MKNKILIIVSLSLLSLFSCKEKREYACNEANEFVYNKLKGHTWDLYYLPNGDTATFFPVFSSQGPNKLILGDDGSVYEPFYFQPQPDTVLADIGTFSVTNCGHTMVLKTNLAAITHPEGLPMEIKSFTPTKVILETTLPLGPNGEGVNTKIVLELVE